MVKVQWAQVFIKDKREILGIYGLEPWDAEIILLLSKKENIFVNDKLIKS